MTKPVWNRLGNSSYAEDGITWTLTVNGQRVGHVDSYKENLGSMLEPRWIVTSYEAVIYGTDDLDKEFEVKGRNPRSVLAEAKRHVLSHV